MTHLVGRVLVCTGCKRPVEVFEAAQGARTDMEHRFLDPAVYVCGECEETRSSPERLEQPGGSTERLAAAGRARTGRQTVMRRRKENRMTAPTRELDLNDLILDTGGHKPPTGGAPPAGAGAACVMEAVAYIGGEPWSDRPQCASPVLGAFLRRLNDGWSDESRQLLKPFIPQLVGTNTGPQDDETRRWMICDWLIHEYLPAIFRSADLPEFAERLERLAAVTGREALG